jgi:hypothetical protein
MSMPSTLHRWFWPKSLGGKFVVVIGFSLLLVVGLWFAALLTTERRLAAAIARCRELGYSEEQRPHAPSVSDALNGAVPFEQACELACVTIDEVSKRHFRAFDERPNGVHAEEAKRLASNSDYERLLNEADERAHFQSSIDAAIPSSILWMAARDHLDDLVDVETQMASDLAAAGEPTKAVDRLLRVLRLFRKRAANDPKMGFVPRYFSQRRVLEELNVILRERSLRDDVHDRIDAELHADDVFTTQLTPVFGQRQFNDLIEQKKESLLHTTFVLRPLANIDEAFAFERLELALVARIMSFREWSKAPHEVYPLAGMFFLKQEWHMDHGVQQVTTFARLNGTSHRARVRSLQILNAMARLKNFNAKLDSLGLPAECLVDPYYGRPMRILNDERGLLIYSVGFNGQDDQGLIDRSNQYDVGFGPSKATKP